MEKEERGKILITYTPREKEALKEIGYLAKTGVLPDNHNEIFRRGLHTVRQLAEIDEKVMLGILLEKLEWGTKNLNKKTLAEITALSLSVYATLIAKRGILRAEAFENIPLTCRQFDLIEEKSVDKKVVPDVLRGLTHSVDMMFLKQPPRELSHEATP